MDRYTELYEPESVQDVHQDLRTNLPAVTGERFDYYLHYNKSAIIIFITSYYYYCR